MFARRRILKFGRIFGYIQTILRYLENSRIFRNIHSYFDCVASGLKLESLAGIVSYVNQDCKIQPEDKKIEIKDGSLEPLISKLSKVTSHANVQGLLHNAADVIDLVQKETTVEQQHESRAIICSYLCTMMAMEII